MATRSARRQPVRGSARIEEEDPNALSLEVLLNRLKQLESQQKLQAIEMQALRDESAHLRRQHEQALREKQQAEEALRAALEKLEQVRREPLPDANNVAIIERVAAVRALENVKAKREKMIDLVRNGKRVPVVNPSNEPVMVTLNGVSWIVPPGESELPEAFLPAWEAHIEEERLAEQRDARIRNVMLPYGTLEAWRSGGQKPDTLWSEG